jgi:hypothetical protein
VRWCGVSVLRPNQRTVQACKRVTPALVLGTVAAHEIGHVLLGGRDHSAEGLMRAALKSDDWQRAASGFLLFSPAEREAMRQTISSCR